MNLLSCAELLCLAIITFALVIGLFAIGKNRKLAYRALFVTALTLVPLAIMVYFDLHNVLDVKNEVAFVYIGLAVFLFIIACVARKDYKRTFASQ
jgi:uncharacterized membrane protein YozB (DUF420 family)